MRAALTGRVLLLRYQPIIRLRNGHTAALEGLVRWPRQEALLQAGAFVPLAEKLGLALDLAHAVLDRVAHDWQQMPSPKGGLAVNMPLSVLLLPEMPALLAATLRRHGARRGPLLLELTETEAIRDPTRLRRVMLRLKRLGIPVLLDDVTLGDHRWRLAGLPFAGVKLDRSLVEALPRQMRARHFLRRILSDSHAKGRYVIAEGVSNSLLQRTTRGLGVDFAQGYLLGQPEPPQQNRGGQTRLSPARRGGRAP
ncbi:MAG: EAL domain-containing protein [Roseomonas sp.]|nr:EAL domain-containing protein [Roseomonas sp.]MCA3391963.1 EAL domain-containing protein [Roseomonas sp.]MCA3407047.1 EAL domain-containing protein [Roseomonas sp.]